MKKTIALLLAVVTLLSLCMTACSGGSGSGETGYRILEETLADEQYVIGFRKDDAALRDKIQETLCAMKKDGMLGEIATEWFGSDTTTVSENFTGSNASDDSWNKVKDAGKFVLGLDDSFPPMGFRDDDNNIVGFDIDVAKEVCSRLGVELVLQPISWDAKEQELSTGKVDCLWNGFSYSDERNEQMCLSDSYMDNRQVVVVTEDSSIQKLADLKDKTLAVQAGSTAVEALEGAADVKASLKGGAGVEVKDNVLAMMDLGTGGSDAVLMDEVVARYYIAKMAK